MWVLNGRNMIGSKVMRYSVDSKASWQKDVEYLTRSKERNAKLGVPQPGLILTHLAEGTDKEVLLTMLRLLQDR